MFATPPGARDPTLLSGSGWHFANLKTVGGQGMVMQAYCGLRESALVDPLPQAKNMFALGIRQ